MCHRHVTLDQIIFLNCYHSNTWDDGSVPLRLELERSGAPCENRALFCVLGVCVSSDVRLLREGSSSLQPSLEPVELRRHVCRA